MTRSIKFENEEIIALQSYGIVKLTPLFLYLLFSPV